jgi:uncharacterized protein with NAD-binding domain and iron-sulfur cluster
MGFYENAFRLLRECYAELGRRPGSCSIVGWQDAFYPAPGAALADRSNRGEWAVWTALMPPGGGLPGDPGRRAQRWTVADYVLRSIGLIGALLERVAAPDTTSGGGAGPRPTLLEGAPDAVMRNMTRLAQKLGPLASVATVIEGTRLLQLALGTVRAYPVERVQEFYDAVERGARAQIETLTHADDEVRRVWELVDILLAVVRGSLRHGLLVAPDGFDAIDRYDCRDWLVRNGASQRSVDGAFVRGLHDLALAYEDGNPTAEHMRFSAGEGLRGSFRAFFNYRGSFFWKMRAGMGDVVFVPFYEVLRRRGVRFEFFHRLRNVRLAQDPGDARPHVRELEFDVQARTVGAREYDPLVTVRGLPSWPSEPRWEQLVDGRQMAEAGTNFESHWEPRRAGKRTLTVSEDFDLVVLGIGLGEVPHVCGELIAQSTRWRGMVEHVATVPTQAFQIWMNEDMKALGWSQPPVSSLSAFEQPFGTWADMAQLVAREDWPEDPRAIAYFCGVLQAEDGLDLDAYRERVRRAAIQFLNRHIGSLWPAATSGGRFRWDLLVDPRRGSRKPRRGAGERRFDSQYWTANVNPSDRYVQSLPGTASFRISPLDTDFDNLTVAGDWTSCGLNIGCVEAAIMSGRLAAHALSKYPALEEIPGFDHP